MTTNTCPRALGRAESCTCGGATCGGERDPLAIVEVDWGRPQRGHGRRRGGMVLGAMSAAPTGIRRYADYRACVPGGMSDAEWEEVRVFAQDEDRDLYVALRRGGASHAASCVAVYAVDEARRVGGEDADAGVQP